VYKGNQISYDNLNEKLKKKISKADFEIVNDLTTGGIEKVLSAEQGKKLAIKFNEHVDDFISVSRFGFFKDSTTIQNALNYAESIGGAVVVAPSGNYNILDIIKIPSNVKLLAEGNVVFKRMAEISAILHNDSDGIIGGYDANKNITVKGITFDANNIEYTSNVTSLAFGHCTGIRVENCEFLNCTTWHDLELNGSKNVVVDNCRFLNYKGTSEMLQLDYAGSSGQFPWFAPFDDTSCMNIEITGCTFMGAGINDNVVPFNDKIKAIGNHSFKQSVTSKNVLISKCHFEGFLYAIYLQDVENLKVEKCVFRDNNTGVVWEQKLNNSKDWTITDCSFTHRDSILTYIGVGGESRFLLGITNEPTLFLEGVLISGNKVHANCTNIIGGTFNNVKIVNNTFEMARRNGIYIYGGDNIIIENNFLTNNARNGEADRADIVAGNNPTIKSKNVIVSNNIFDKIISVNTNENVIATNNIIKNFLQFAGGAQAKNNMIAGVWTP